MSSRNVFMVLAVTALVGCAGSDHDDLKKFVENSSNGMRGRVDPLPQMAAYEPMTYDAFDLADPFQPRKIEPDKTAGGGGGPAPDTNRRKEALEAFPLESLSMVGTLERANKRFALVRTPDNNLYRVAPGNYMGQNFGLVAAVADTSVTLKEMIQDTNGSWTERTSTLQLLDQEEKK